MRKAIKICLCMLTITLVVCSFTLPCLAVTWGEAHPNTVKGASIQNITNYRDYATVDYLIQLAEKAYNIGLSGGGYPIAITASVSNETIRFYFCFSAPSDPKTYPDYGYGAPKDSTPYVFLGSDSTHTTNQIYYKPFQSSANVYAYSVCYLYEDGSLSCSPSSTYPVATTATTGTKLVAIYGYRGQEGWYKSTGGLWFAQSSSTSGTIAPELEQINANYNEALENNQPQPPTVNVNYTLDIPGIITAIPNGAKQMINNAFGFEIFGINVAGLLSVVLIVTIVAFVVKWLMSR